MTFYHQCSLPYLVSQWEVSCVVFGLCLVSQSGRHFVSAAKGIKDNRLPATWTNFVMAATTTVAAADTAIATAALYGGIRLESCPIPSLFFPMFQNCKGASRFSAGTLTILEHQKEQIPGRATCQSNSASVESLMPQPIWPFSVHFTISLVKWTPDYP